MCADPNLDLNVRMNAPTTPNPPKACPVCQVAMQATRRGEDTVHRCERCSLTITVSALRHRDERQPRPS